MSQTTATAPTSAPRETPSSHQPRSTNLLALAALGVVFGDIGTSPLYAMQAIFTGDHPVRATAADVYGVISLVAWSLTLIKGTAVFLNPTKETTPLALRIAQTRLRAIPEEVVILTIDIGNEPTVPDGERSELDHLGNPDDGLSHLTLRYGYQDNPDVPRGINVARDQGLVNFNPYHVTYYLSQMALVPFGDQGMAPWRKDLFMAMNRNAASPVGYFNLPAEHVVGLGGQIRF